MYRTATVSSQFPLYLPISKPTVSNTNFFSVWINCEFIINVVFKENGLVYWEKMEVEGEKEIILFLYQIGKE